MHTWNEFSFDHPVRFIFLSFWDPKYVNILKAGHHLLNSISQFMMIVVGTTIRWGPQIPLSQANADIRAMVWIVLPSPISSARIPLSFLSCKVINQSNPMTWYSLNFLFSKNGILVLTQEFWREVPVGWAELALAIAKSTSLSSHSSLYAFLKL